MGRLDYFRLLGQSKQCAALNYPNQKKSGEKSERKELKTQSQAKYIFHLTLLIYMKEFLEKLNT